VSIIDEVAAERQKQIEKGYDAAHDDEHGWMHVRYIARLNLDWTTDERESMVKAAASLVAAVEAFDREQSR